MVVIAEGSHLFPFRTQSLSSLAPMVLRGQLRGRVGHRHLPRLIFLCNTELHSVGCRDLQSRTQIPFHTESTERHGKEFNTEIAEITERKNYLIRNTQPSLTKTLDHRFL